MIYNVRHNSCIAGPLCSLNAIVLILHFSEFLFSFLSIVLLLFFFFFFFNDTPPPEIYPLPLHAAFPIPIKHPPPLLVARSEKGALLVGDEAPSPRNRGSQAGQEVTALPRQFLLLLTATPVQNSLEE